MSIRRSVKRYAMQGTFMGPVILSALLTFVVVLLLPRPGKFRLEHVQSGLTDKLQSMVFFFDLDGDGASEKYILFNSKKKEAAVKVLGSNGNLVHWEDFRGALFPGGVISGNYDHDDRGELFFFSHTADSLFLNQLTSVQPKAYTAVQHFIAVLQKQDDSPDFEVRDAYFVDYQSDGYLDLAFTVAAGYSLQPRRFYVFDAKNDSLFQGPLMAYQCSFLPINLDEDPYPEYIGSGGSTNNYQSNSTSPYLDDGSYLMVLDHDLDFLFNPLKFPGHKSDLSCMPLLVGGKLFLHAVLYHSDADSSYSHLLLYDLQGKLLRANHLPAGERWAHLNQLQGPSPICYLKDEKGNIGYADTSLRIVHWNTLQEHSFSSPGNIDIDGDAAPEMIFMSDDYASIIVTRQDYHHPARAGLPFGRMKANVSVQQRGNGQNLLFVQKGDWESWLRYSRNPMYFLQYFLWLALFAGVLAVYFLIRWQVLYQVKIRQANTAALTRLQLSQLNHHLDPHFTFNALNTIGSMIFKDDKAAARRLLQGFSELIRFTLDHSADWATTLGEEITFVNGYLEVQRSRFDDSIRFETVIEGTPDMGLPVPKFLLQQYAENAIKHGLSRTGYEGLLHIRITQESKRLIIKIMDNGVGRGKPAGNLEQSLGSGLKTMEEIYRLFAKLTGIQVKQEIEDLFDGQGTPAGTRVHLTLTYP